MTFHNNTPPDEGNELATEQIEPLQINSLIFPLYQSLFWWIGILLLLAAKAISLAYKENDEQAFMQFMSRMKTIFTILGFTSVAMIVASLYLLNYAIEKSLF
jgi:nitrogen fixation/metabolism regulation signal transduction histidine kinase